MSYSNIGLYIHIPFCVSKCGYCDFYSIKADDEIMDNYTISVCNALENNPYKNTVADTLYFGGGTPILLGAKRLDKILNTANKNFGLTNAEITLEANPYSTLKDTLVSLKASGINRISFGLQSAVNSQLKLLSRNHTVESARTAVNDAVTAGFRNISLDLMLGIPTQTVENVTASIAFCSDLGVQHISAYILKLEENTPFGKLYNDSDFDEDLQAEIYLSAVSQLEQCEFKQYEISNFAKPSFESKHNLKYWNCENYLGIGPSAYSFMNGERFSFERNINSFMTAKNPFNIVKSDGIGGDFEEYAMLRLRLNDGLYFDEIEKKHSINRSVIIKRAEKLPKWLVTISDDKIALTSEGFLLSNSVIGRLVF